MRQSHHHLECAFKAWDATVDALFGVITNYRVAVELWQALLGVRHGASILA